MKHETLNDKGREFHSLHVRNPHALFPDMLDPLAAEEKRAQWGDPVTEELSDSDYFGKGEAWDVDDVSGTNYGAELGSLAVGLDNEQNDKDGARDAE